MKSFGQRFQEVLSRINPALIIAIHLDSNTEAELGAGYFENGRCLTLPLTTTFTMEKHSFSKRPHTTRISYGTPHSLPYLTLSYKSYSQNFWYFFEIIDVYKTFSPIAYTRPYIRTIYFLIIHCEHC